MVAFLALGLWGASEAWAHDFLVSSNPAAGSTVSDRVTSVTLTFNDLVLTKPSPADVVVVGPDGRHYETGCASSVDRDVTVPVALGPDGQYVVTWRIVSADGHPVSASISFSLKARTGASGAKGSAQSACHVRGESTSSAAPSAPSGDSSSSWGWLAAGVLAVCVVVIAARLWSVRRRDTAGVLNGSRGDES